MKVMEMTEDNCVRGDITIMLNSGSKLFGKMLSVVEGVGGGTIFILTGESHKESYSYQIPEGSVNYTKTSRSK